MTIKHDGRVSQNNNNFKKDFERIGNKCFS